MHPSLRHKLNPDKSFFLVYSQDSLPESMDKQAPTVIPSSVTGKVSRWQNLGPAQPAQKMAQPQHLVPDRCLEKALEGSGLLQKLGVSREVTPREEVKGRASSFVTLILELKQKQQGGWCFVECEQGPGCQPCRDRPECMPPSGVLTSLPVPPVSPGEGSLLDD